MILTKTLYSLFSSIALGSIPMETVEANEMQKSGQTEISDNDLTSDMTGHKPDLL